MKLEYSAAEQMVVCGSREIKDGDVVYVGVGLPTLATWLAKYTHAPRCVVVHEVGIIRTTPCPLGLFQDSLGVQTRADALAGVFSANALAAGGFCDKGFLGAGQIDRYGNVNSTVAGDYYKPAHRWPGSGGGNDVMSLCRNVVIILRQTRQRFPEKVDFITSPGYLDGRPGQREESGLLPGTGPVTVITDMGVYRFRDREMVLKSIHVGLGISVEDCRREIGWDLQVDPHLETTQPPTDEELRILREKVDPSGIFVGGKFALKEM